MFTNLNSPTIVEVLGDLGARFVVFDTAHSATNRETMSNMIRAAELNDLMTMIRIEGPDKMRAVRASDVGALGIWVQFIETAKELREFIDALRFPPEGVRGCCLYPRIGKNSAGDWEEMFDFANNTLPFLVVDINTEVALENLDEMLEVPEVHAFCVSPMELTIRTGYGEFDDPIQFNLGKAIGERIKAAGKLLFGPFSGVRDTSDIEGAVEIMSQLKMDVWFTADIGAMWTGFQQYEILRSALEEHRQAELKGEEQAANGDDAKDDPESTSD